MLRFLLDSAQLFREPYYKLWHSVCAYLKRECMLVILDGGFSLTWVVGPAVSNFLPALGKPSDPPAVRIFSCQCLSPAVCLGLCDEY